VPVDNRAGIEVRSWQNNDPRVPAPADRAAFCVLPQNDARLTARDALYRRLRAIPGSYSHAAKRALLRGDRPG